MIVAKRALHALLAIFDLISNCHSWNIVNIKDITSISRFHCMHLFSILYL